MVNPIARTVETLGINGIFFGLEGGRVEVGVGGFGGGVTLLVVVGGLVVGGGTGGVVDLIVAVVVCAAVVAALVACCAAAVVVVGFGSAFDASRCGGLIGSAFGCSGVGFGASAGVGADFLLSTLNVDLGCCCGLVANGRLEKIVDGYC